MSTRDVSMGERGRESKGEHTKFHIEINRLWFTFDCSMITNDLDESCLNAGNSIKWHFAMAFRYNTMENTWQESVRSYNWTLIRWLNYAIFDFVSSIGSLLNYWKSENFHLKKKREPCNQKSVSYIATENCKVKLQHRGQSNDWRMSFDKNTIRVKWSFGSIRHYHLKHGLKHVIQWMECYLVSL